MADARLSSKRPDGTTAWDHLEEAARLGHRPSIDRLNAVPEYPDALEYLRDIFGDVHARSGFSPAGGISPLTWATLDHYQRVTGRRLSQREADALIELDMALIQDEIERAKETQPQPNPSTEHG